MIKQLALAYFIDNSIYIHKWGFRIYILRISHYISMQSISPSICLPSSKKINSPPKKKGKSYDAQSSFVFSAATTPKDCSPTLSPLNAFSRSMDNSSLSRSVEQLSSPLESEPRRNKQPPPVVAPAAHSRSSATRGGTWGSISR